MLNLNRYEKRHVNIITAKLRCILSYLHTSHHKCFLSAYNMCSVIFILHEILVRGLAYCIRLYFVCCSCCLVVDAVTIVA